MSRDPPDISGAPENIPVAIVECILMGHRDKYKISTCCMEYALWFSGRAGGIENKEWVFRVLDFRFACGGEGVKRFVIPDVTVWIPIYFCPGSFDYKNLLNPLASI